MSLLNAPASVSFADGVTAPNYFKAFTNFMTAQTKLHGDKPFARYMSNGKYKTMSYADVDRVATNLACKWAKDAQSTEVISFISDHTINYLVVMLAIMKLRTTMLAISPRNSEAADVDLLEKTQSKLLIAHTKYEEIAKGAASKVDGVKVIVIQPLDIEALVKEPLNPEHEKILDTNFSDEDIKKPALIIHSSGTTAFPKPIYLSNQYLFIMINLLHVNIAKNKQLQPLESSDVFLSCTPLFHIFGFFAVFTMATVGGSVIFLPNLPPTQEDIHQALVDNNATVMCAPPLILEQMIPYIKQKNDFATAQKLKYILFGGAPLKKQSGDWFQTNGINVRSVYGTTEIGPIMSSNFDPSSKNWESVYSYMTDENGKPYGCFELNDPNEPGIYHFYVRPGYPGFANVSNREGGGYNTNDLFVENPNFPGYYTYIGRRDDTLIMENGEKTNPVPMEATLRQSHMIKQAAVLGQDRQCTAALVELDKQFALDYSPQQIIDEVNRAVKEVNVECPGHSALLPQMVMILPFNKSLPSTDKGTVQRKKAERMYQDEVDKMYKDFLEGPVRDKSNIDADTSKWSAEQTEDFLVGCTSDVLGRPRSEFKDLSQSVFNLGLSSLTAIQLRNKISEYFDNVPQNFLFQHPSINAMRDALMSGESEDLSEQLEKRAQQTQDLAVAYIKKAKLDFPVARSDYSDKKDKVVMLTGATGSLGAFMLEYLLQDAEVKKVYCVVRGKQEQLFARLVDAFKSRDLDESLLHTGRVEVLPMRFNDPFLGFGEERYNQLRDEVTIVQHCAWLLDFNLTIEHYDRECIAPFYNLLKFAYRETNPMHVHFISSVSASAAYGPEIPEEPLPLDAHVTMPMGYAQSKFVCEILLDYLTTEKNFPCYVERLGQVCGDSDHGVWNKTEQFPLMFIGGGSVMHKMPALETVIDWIPVNYASYTICDIMMRTAYLNANRDESIYHIVNPGLVQWPDVLEAMRGAGMKFDVVPPLEWVETLSKDDKNPAYTLMSFYETNFKEDFKFPVWKTEKTAKVAPVIDKCPIINSSLFSKFLNRWQSVGFYNPAN